MASWRGMERTEQSVQRRPKAVGAASEEVARIARIHAPTERGAEDFANALVAALAERDEARDFSQKPRSRRALAPP